MPSAGIDNRENFPLERQAGLFLPLRKRPVGMGSLRSWPFCFKTGPKKKSPLLPHRVACAENEGMGRAELKNRFSFGPVLKQKGQLRKLCGSSHPLRGQRDERVPFLSNDN